MGDPRNAKRARHESPCRFPATLPPLAVSTPAPRSSASLLIRLPTALVAHAYSFLSCHERRQLALASQMLHSVSLLPGAAPHVALIWGATASDSPLPLPASLVRLRARELHICTVSLSDAYIPQISTMQTLHTLRMNTFCGGSIRADYAR